MRKALRKFLLAVLVALAVPLAAQPVPANPAPRYTRLSMDDGLSNNSVYCLRQDRLGFLWFGTFAGLNRYDGTGFSIYKPGRSIGGDNLPGALQGSVIFALEEDVEGRLWVGTDGGGLSLYHRETDAFETFRKQAGSGGLPSDRIFALAADPGGGLWIGTGNGGLAFRKAGAGTITRLQPPSALPFVSVRCLLVRPDGSVLAGTEDAGLVRYEPAAKRFSRVPLDDRADGMGTVRALVEGPDHRVWVGLASGALETLMPGAARTQLVLPPGPSAIRTLSFDALGRLWVGYESDGAVVLDVSGKSPRVLTRDPGAGNVRAIGTDNNGLVWIARKDGGILVHNPASEQFLRFGLKSVRGLAETRSGEILAGTDGSGLYRLRRDAGGMEPVSLPAGYDRIYSVLEDRAGNLWIGTDGLGLLRQDGRGRVTTFRRDPADPGSLSSDVVWALVEDRAGTLWIGTEGGGLDRWNPKTGGFDHFRPREDDPASLLGSSVRTVCPSADGRLWIGTWDGGLCRLDPATGRCERFPELADSSVNALLEDSKGWLWIGTGSAGLALLKPDHVFSYVAKKDGLAGDTVTGILQDKDGSLWVATAERVSRFDPGTGSIFHLGEEDGLADSECSQNACLQARDGALWIGGPGGLSRFRPEAVRPDIRPPRVVFTRVETFGPEGPELIKGLGGRVPPSAELDWRNMGIRFDAALIDFMAPGRNRYAMFIEGLSEGWLPLGEQHGAVIPPLPPGTFTIHVRGTDGNGISSAMDATFRVHVRPPLWRNPLALAAAFLLLAGTAGGLVVLRMRALARRTEVLRSYSRHVQEAREEERIAAAREVHDEIGQHLAALNLQAYWMQTHPDAPAPVRGERMAEMLGSISDAMSAVKSVATSLRPIALDALKFEEAVSWYARSFEHRSGMAITVEIHEGFPAVQGALATSLFRVLQEMLTNVSRHSGASHVEVRLAHAFGAITLEVQDDGKGIAPDEAEADDAFGIIGMRERCAAFGGRFEARGVSGEGTTFTARIPFMMEDQGPD